MNKQEQIAIELTKAFCIANPGTDKTVAGIVGRYRKFLDYIKLNPVNL